jgi:hypothetical protein
MSYPGPNSNAAITSPNASYDHQYCRNAYIQEIVIPPAGSNHNFLAEYAGPTLISNQPFPCNASWAQLMIFKYNDMLDASDPWEKVREATGYGSLMQNGACAPGRASTGPLPAGRYKLYGRAGAIFTHTPVKLALVTLAP